MAQSHISLLYFLSTPCEEITNLLASTQTALSSVLPKNMLYYLYCFQSSGDLQNDEETAALMLQMTQGCGKLMNSLNSERKGSFHRLSG